MRYQHLTSDRQLAEFCDAIADAELIAFDTEFVSENSYRPELCLVQIAAGGRLAVLDTIAVSDLRPLWELLASEGHTTIVHAGREELCFSLHSIGRRPHQLFDIQIAAGLIGWEYPAAYGTLVYKLLGRSPDKGETRTNWRRRPLSERQIEYALEDVIFLEPMYEQLVEQLRELGRLAWMDDEMQRWQQRVETAEFHDRWRKAAGLTNLSRKSLAVYRELWQWRDETAQRENRPPRRVLRDDLVIELAKRASADPTRVRAIRGMERRDVQNRVPEIAARIGLALNLPEDQWPEKSPRSRFRPQYSVLGQFLATALGSICRKQSIAPGLVGTVQDVRDLVAHRLDNNKGDQTPALLDGWRAEIVGVALDDLLNGKVAVRVVDPLSDQPLEFEPVPNEPPDDSRKDERPAGAVHNDSGFD